MKIVFFGNPSFALPTLRALFESHHDIEAVVTSPDKPRGRGKKIVPLPVKQFALDHSLRVLQPEKLSDASFLDEIRALNPDVFVVIAFRILPRVLFALPKYGSLNVHPSLLPKSRGPAPIRWTLLNGETETGVTIIQLSEQIDGGAILAQESTTILPEENFGTLHDRLAVIGATLLTDVLSKIENGSPPKSLLQDETAVTKAPKLYPKDFEIDWNLTAKDIHNRIRAFSPEPGAHTLWYGEPFKILIVKEAIDRRYEQGKLVRDGDELFVGTGSHALRLIVVKPAGKRAMETAEFLRGRPVVPDFLGK